MARYELKNLTRDRTTVQLVLAVRLAETARAEGRPSEAELYEMMAESENEIVSLDHLIASSGTCLPVRTQLHLLDGDGASFH